MLKVTRNSRIRGETGLEDGDGKEMELGRVYRSNQR